MRFAKRALKVKAMCVGGGSSPLRTARHQSKKPCKYFIYKAFCFFRKCRKMRFGACRMRDMQSIVRKHGDTAVRSYDRAAVSATAHSFLRNRRFRPRCRQAAPFSLTTGTPERKIRWFHFLIGRHRWRKNRNPFQSFLIKCISSVHIMPQKVCVLKYILYFWYRSALLLQTIKN